jgi:hypothetical protein
MALVTMQSPYVRAHHRFLSPDYKKVVESAFSLDDYCMAGCYGCKHGGHSTWGSKKYEATSMDTVLDLDAFFGIEATAFNAEEEARLGFERERITDQFYQVVENLYKLLNDTKLDLGLQDAFMREFRQMNTFKATIKKSSKKLADAKQSLGDFNAMVQIERRVLEDEIASLDALNLQDGSFLF